MPSRDLDFPVFDADNHMYETTEALTKFLPESVRGRHRLRRGRRPHEDHGQEHDQRVHPEPHLRAAWPRRARRRSTSRSATPTARPAGRSWARPSHAPAAFREPGPRLELMDELGLDRALMWPTLASLVEERLRDDVDAIHAVVHALNEWMHETWTFNYEDRIFPTPVITLPIVEEAIKELEWVTERGAKIILIRPAPVPGLRGPRSFALPSSTRSGSSCRRRTSSSACTPPTAATSATSTSGRASATR